MGIGKTVGSAAAKMAGSTAVEKLVPQVGGNVVRTVLDWAVDGKGRIVGAARMGDNQLRKGRSQVDAADALINLHLRLAGAQGFVTNLGGAVTALVAMPANIVAVAILQCRLVASIYHLRGYDLADQAVRDAILLTLLEPKVRKRLGKEFHRTLDPAVVARAPHDPESSAAIAKAVTAELIGAAGGKRVAAFAARRIPILGGVVGGIGDAMSTRRIGREAAEIGFGPHHPRTLPIDGSVTLERLDEQ